ncbi:hypothetical protein BRD17_09965 [Halobacteriales archaeon SW_7_68_16]|nr:MAG: hypothetical protein BRD17_09965 [Halobacteriales archaeon SW_7_68_16]
MHTSRPRDVVRRRAPGPDPPTGHAPAIVEDSTRRLRNVSAVVPAVETALRDRWWFGVYALDDPHAVGQATLAVLDLDTSGPPVDDGIARRDRALDGR